METLAITTGAARRVQEFAVVAAVAALLLLFVTDGALSRLTFDGGHKSTPASVEPAATQVKPPFDVNAVVGKARHAITAVPGKTGALQVVDPGYRATFDRTGFTYTPKGATAGFAISAATVKRGDHSLSRQVGTWKANSNVAARELTTGVREQVTAHGGNIEWDVVLTAPPAGTGDLIVSADLGGTVGDPRPVDAGKSWRLKLTDGATVDLGETVVTDATGTQLYRALPTILNGRIELIVRNRILQNAAYPLTIDPTVSGPTTVTTEPVSDTGSIAFDGEDFLVVYQTTVGNCFEIAGVQVAGDGSAVQPIGLLSQANDGQCDTRPDVAWNGSRFLVVWQQQFNSNDIDILGRKVSAAGFPQGGIIPVSRPTTFQSAPTVAAAGSAFYVAWTDSRTGGGNIFGGRVTDNGNPLDGDGVAVTTDGHSDEPDVAWNGSNFLVAHRFLNSNLDVYAQRVNASAIPVGAPIVVSAVSGNQDIPAVASDGSGFLVVWADNRDNSSNPSIGYDIKGSRVTGTGTVLDGGIAFANGPDEQFAPAVAFNAGTYLVTWNEQTPQFPNDDIYARRLRSDGILQDPNPNGFAIAANPPDVERGAAIAPGPGGGWAIDYGLGTNFPNGTSSLALRRIAPK